jgi:hypothetical protein
MADANNELAPVEKKERKKREPKFIVAQPEIQKVDDSEKWPVEAAYLAMTFEHSKKYMFELATQNMEREMPVIEVDGQKSRAIPSEKYKPYQNIVLTSQIIWKGQRRILRYYDGCTSIFADEQPKDKEEIDAFIKVTQPRAFLKGKFGAYGDEKMLLMYLMICSWNADSPFRTRSANEIFKATDTVKIASTESAKLDETERALQLAKDASRTKMLIHSAFLGIETLDFDSGNELTDSEIRTKYRRRALQDAAYFIESYGNKSIEVKYYINQALIKGLITNKFNPNKATWQNGKEICDISGLKSNDAIGEKIFEFSQLEDGQEFTIQLRALFS